MIEEIGIIFFIIIAICYIIWDYIFKFLCKVFLFHPKREYQIYDSTFKNINKFTIKTIDNISLDGYILRNDSNIYIIYSHGSIGDIYTRTEFANELSKFGNVVMYDYRGFGLSEGSPSESGLNNDLTSVWKFLVETKKVNPSEIILFGEQVGCSVVAKFVNQLTILNKQIPRALIFQSIFSSLKDLVNDYSSFLSCFIDEQFNTLESVKKINIPIMIIQNEDTDTTHHCEKFLFDYCFFCKTKMINEFDDILSSVMINFIQRPNDYIQKSSH